MNTERNKAIESLVARLLLLRDELSALTDKEVDNLEIASANWEYLEECEFAINCMEDAWDGMDSALSDLKCALTGGAKHAETA